MKKIFILILSIILVTTGCKKEVKSEPREKYEGDTAENITMIIKEGTLTEASATVIIKDLTGKDNIYGDGYDICEKINNDCFYLTPITNSIGLLLEHHVDENDLLEIKTNWEGKYGKLKSGEYKLIRGVSIENKGEVYVFSADFTIK